MATYEESCAALQAEIDKHDPYDAEHTMFLACWSGHLGMEAEAVEFFVRYLALKQGVEIGEELAGDLLVRLKGTYESLLEGEPAASVKRAVQFTVAFVEAVNAPEPVYDMSKYDPSATLAMYEATRPMRERAMAARFSVDPSESTS